MKKPHVLFVTEKYADANPAWLSNSHHNLFGSLDYSELATRTNFFFEEHPYRLDDNLMTYHRRLSPDLTVVTILANPSYGGNPSHRAFEDLASRGPVVFIWFDAIQKFIMDRAKTLAPYSTLNVVLDHPFFTPEEKFMAMWTPQDPRIYNDPNFQRDIDVSFLGTVEGYSDRSSGIDYLSTNMPNALVHRDGGQRDRNLTPNDYAKAMQRSKISLSFSKTRNGYSQTKGRVWEITLCGAMLMEDANQGTGLWFEPFKDYVPFVSNEDLLEKANYYLNNPDKMAEIAGNGKRKSELYYSPKNWWSTIFDKCGVKTSTSLT